MKKSSFWLGALGALAILLAVAQAKVLINAAGATFPYPIYGKWFEEFTKADPDAQINYQSIGSGGGIRQFTEGTVDFGASDMPMTDEQIGKFKNKPLHFPTVLGGLVPTYNAPWGGGFYGGGVYRRGYYGHGLGGVGRGGLGGGSFHGGGGGFHGGGGGG